MKLLLIAWVDRVQRTFTTKILRISDSRWGGRLFVQMECVSNLHMTKDYLVLMNSAKMACRIVSKSVLSEPSTQIGVRGGPWDGSKSHRRRQSHVTNYMHNPEMAQNSNHFCLEFNFCSNFEPSQSFRTKKWANSEFRHVIKISRRK